MLNLRPRAAQVEPCSLDCAHQTRDFWVARLLQHASFMSNGLARRLELDADEAMAPGSRPQEKSQIRRRYQLSRPRLDLGAVPRRLVDNRALVALPLDQRSAFVISQIDGMTPLRTIVDVTGVGPEELLALVERLIEMDAIAIL